MKWLVLFLIGVVPLLYGGYYIISSRDEMVENLKHFCGATHAGEPWPHVLERARKADLEFLRANASTEKVEEWMAKKESFGKRWGCRVFVQKGLVTETRTGELPSE